MSFNKKWKGNIEDIYATSILVRGKTFYLPKEGGIREKVATGGFELGNPVIATHDPKGNLVDLEHDRDGEKTPGVENQPQPTTETEKVHIKQAKLPVVVPGAASPVPCGDVTENVHIEPVKPSQPPTPVTTVPVIATPKATDRMIMDIEKQEVMLIQFCINRSVELVNAGWVKRKESNEDDLTDRIEAVKKASDKLHAYAKTKLKGGETQ